MIAYLLICAACDPGGQMPMPFGNPQEREKWRAQHAEVRDHNGTPHNAFTLYDQPIDEHRWGTAHDQYQETRNGGDGT